MIAHVMRFTEAELNKMESLLGELNLDPEIERELTKRASQSEKDIAEGKIYTIKDAEARLSI